MNLAVMISKFLNLTNQEQMVSQSTLSSKKSWTRSCLFLIIFQFDNGCRKLALSIRVPPQVKQVKLLMKQFYFYLVSPFRKIQRDEMVCDSMTRRSSRRCHRILRVEQLNLVQQLFQRQKMRALSAEYAINLLSGLDSYLFPLWLQILYPLVQSNIILLKFLKVVVLNFQVIFFIKGVCYRVEEQMIQRGQYLQRVDRVRKQVSLSIIWQRKISPFVVLQMAIPTSLEQYSIILMMCSLMFCFRPVVLMALFSMDRFVCMFQDYPPLSSVKRQLTLRLLMDLPVFGIMETEGEGYLELIGVLLIVCLFESNGGVLLLVLSWGSFDFFYSTKGFKLFFIYLNSPNYSQFSVQSYDYPSSFFYCPQQVELVRTKEVDR